MTVCSLLRIRSQRFILKGRLVSVHYLQMIRGCPISAVLLKESTTLYCRTLPGTFMLLLNCARTLHPCHFRVIRKPRALSRKEGCVASHHRLIYPPSKAKPFNAPLILVQYGQVSNYERGRTPNTKLDTSCPSKR